MSKIPFSELFWEFIARVFILLPLPLLFFFVLSLVLFLTAPKGSDKRKKRKTWFIVVSIIAGIMLLIWIAIVAYFTLSIARM